MFFDSYDNVRKHFWSNFCECQLMFGIEMFFFFFFFVMTKEMCVSTFLCLFIAPSGTLKQNTVLFLMGMCYFILQKKIKDLSTMMN